MRSFGYNHKNIWSFLLFGAALILLFATLRSVFRAEIVLSVIWGVAFVAAVAVLLTRILTKKITYEMSDTALAVKNPHKILSEYRYENIVSVVKVENFFSFMRDFSFVRLEHVANGKETYVLLFPKDIDAFVESVSAKKKSQHK